MYPLVCTDLLCCAFVCVCLCLFMCAVTHTWHHSRPQPTGPSGPPYSAFCSEIIPHCLVLYLPQLHSSLSTPTFIPLNLCDNASSAGVAASRGGRGACQAPMSLSTNAQSAEEAQESRLLLACPR